MRPISTCVLLALLAGLAGCGDENGPVAPTPTAVLTGISITPGTDLVKIKATESLTLTATYSNGTSKTVQATWSSSASDVASIDAAGRVTGVAPGIATVFADYEGRRATRPLRVVPDYQGRWEGDWSVTACSGDGDWQEMCVEFPIGQLVGLTLVVAQDRDQITGTTDFGDDLPGAVKGSIRSDGTLVVSGTYVINLDDMPLELTVTDWETISFDNQRMTGHLCVIGRVAGLPGSFQIDGELRVVSKMSATAAGVGGESGRRGLVARIRGR